MARKLRIHYEGALYHVICRGNNREFVFKDDKWKESYIGLIERYKKKYRFKLYAYVIMDNHVHLLIEVGVVPLSKIMQGIQQVFTQRYNKASQRSGHVFEQRYKAVLCDKDQYLLGLIRYIHHNPMRAGVSKGLDYTWSSYERYMKKEKELVDIDFPLSLFDYDINKLNRFMNEADDEIGETPNSVFSESIDEYEIKSKEEKPKLRLTLDEMIKIVCDEYQITEEDIIDGKRTNYLNEARRLLVALSLMNPDISQKKVAERLKRRENTISMMVNKSDLLGEFADIIEKLLTFDV